MSWWTNPTSLPNHIFWERRGSALQTIPGEPYGDKLYTLTFKRPFSLISLNSKSHRTFLCVMGPLFYWVGRGFFIWNLIGLFRVSQSLRPEGTVVFLMDHDWTFQGCLTLVHDSPGSGGDGDVWPFLFFCVARFGEKKSQHEGFGEVFNDWRPHRWSLSKGKCQRWSSKKTKVLSMWLFPRAGDHPGQHWEFCWLRQHKSGRRLLGMTVQSLWAFFTL